MRPDISLAAEATTQEVRYDIDLLLGYAEHDRQELPGAEDMLGRFIERQRAVGVPGRRRRVRLHLVVVAIGRRVGLLDLDGSRGDCVIGVADRRSDRPEKLWRIDGLVRALPTEHHRSSDIVLDPDQRPGMSGLIPGTGGQQGDWLARVVDLVVLKRQVGLPVRMQVAPGLWRWVHARHGAIGEHPEYAGRFFGGRGIDRDRPAVRDGALDDRGVGRVGEWNIRRVARRTGDFEPSVEACEGLSDGVHPRAPALSSSRRATRWWSSTLNAL